MTQANSQENAKKNLNPKGLKKGDKVATGLYSPEDKRFLIEREGVVVFFPAQLFYCFFTKTKEKTTIQIILF